MATPRTTAAPVPAACALGPGLRAYLTAGALSGPGRPILRLLGHAPPRVRFAVPEDKARSLSVGSLLAIETPSADHKGNATLLGMTPEVDNASGMVYATATVDTGEGADPQLSKGGLIVRVLPRQDARAEC